MNKLVIKKESLAGLLLVGTVMVLVYNPYGFFSVSLNVAKIIFLAISIFTIFTLSFMRQNAQKQKQFFKSDIAKQIMLPDILIMVFSLAVSFLNPTQYDVSGSTLYMFTSRLLMITFIWSCLCIFGERAINYFFWGCALSYLYTLVKYFIDMGIVEGLRQASINGSYNLTIEVHNMTYIFGYLFLYFLLMDSVSSKKSKWIKVFLCLVFVYFGQKRLIFVSIVIVLFIWWILHRLKAKDRKWIVRIGSIVLLVTAVLYIYAIISGLFERIVVSNDIETSSRLRFYMYFAKDLPFSPFYFGKGITYTDEVMASSAGMAALELTQATTLHNDVLRLYIGIGMIPSFLYMGYVIYMRTIAMQKEYNERVGFCCFAMTMAYFMNWFASNAGLEMWCYSGYIFCIMTIMYKSYFSQTGSTAVKQRKIEG